MLVKRIVGAFTFHREVYAEVKSDTAFTTTAWILVAVVALLNQIGSFAVSVNVDGRLLNWLISSVVGTFFAIFGFFVAASMISEVGRRYSSGGASFDGMVRTLGLAYVWNVVGILGIVSVFLPEAVLVSCIAPILGLVSWLIAVKEALDLEWGLTIVPVVIAWIVQFVLLLIAGLVLLMYGLTSTWALPWLSYHG
jgi:hypothetical protein